LRCCLIHWFKKKAFQNQFNFFLQLPDFGATFCQSINILLCHIHLFQQSGMFLQIQGGSYLSSPRMCTDWGHIVSHHVAFVPSLDDNTCSFLTFRFLHSGFIYFHTRQP
jgi:hypothetical protein